jgi:phospholipid/cholesterol/gamma-HCH transport system permease protein
MSLHTRSALVRFGSQSLIPAVTALAMFRELGPLMTGLLTPGRVGAGIGAELAEMRVTEQIDALESLAIDSFKYLAVTRILACTIALPILTILMAFAGLVGGFLSEVLTSHMSLRLYFDRAFQKVDWSDYIPPTLKTLVFGFLIGTVSSYLGYTAKQGAAGVGRASTSSVAQTLTSAAAGDDQQSHSPHAPGREQVCPLPGKYHLPAGRRPAAQTRKQISNYFDH